MCVCVSSVCLRVGESDGVYKLLIACGGSNLIILTYVFIS